MRRLITAIVLVASLLNQSIVMAGDGLVYHALDEGLEHAVLHLDGSGHHHHDDGSVHEDDSEQSKRHAHADGALTAAVVPEVAPLTDTTYAHFAAAEGPSCAAAEHFSPGPSRPPRLTA